MKACRRIMTLSIILAFLIILPAEAYAADRSEDRTRVKELVSLRRGNSKTYLLEDGTYETAVYSNDIHYLDNRGKYCDIINRLVGEKSEKAETDYKYKNQSGAYTVRFADNIGGYPVLVEYGKSSVAFRPVDADESEAYRYNKSRVAELGIDRRSSIIYKDVYAGVDMVYEAADNGVKEYIVLKEFSGKSGFTFELKLDGLHIKEYGGSICFEDGRGRSIFKLGELFAVDSAGAYTDDVKCEVIESRGVIRLKIAVAESYLTDPDRAYPVVIDPSVMITGSNNTFDSYVNSQNPNTNYYMNQYIRTGHSPTLGTQRTYIKFNLPDNIAAGAVTSVKLRVKRYGGSTPSIKAYRVTSGWTSSTLTWANKPGYTGTNASSKAVNDSGEWYSMEVKPIVLGWMQGSYSKCGFLLMSDMESYPSTSTAFYSSDAPSPNKPELRIYHESVLYYGNRPYLSVPYGTTHNCMGYALNIKQYINSSDMGFNGTHMDQQNIDGMLSYIKLMSEIWMNENLGSNNYKRIANYYSPIELDQYRVVLRVWFDDTLITNGLLDYTGDPFLEEPENNERWGYHWWYQTKDGTWAEKDGIRASRLIPGVADPGSVNWYESTFIYSDCVYYAVNYNNTI